MVYEDRDLFDLNKLLRDSDTNKDHELFEDEEEKEETLSLCDLPIYCDSFKSVDNDFSSHSSSETDDHHNDHEDFFEFFSEEFTSNSSKNQTDIIFCGKIIPYKAQRHDDTIIHEETVPQRNKNDMRKNRRPSNDDKRRSSSSTLVAAMIKPRWYVYMFGVVGFPTVPMGLNNMRARQRRSRSLSSPAKHETINENDLSFRRDKKSRGIASWGFLRALGCINM